MPELGNTSVAQDVNKLPLVGSPLLLSCFIQGLHGFRKGMSIILLDYTKKRKSKKEKHTESKFNASTLD